jgi:hypothetical protein
MNEITLKIADMVIDDTNIEGGVKYVGEKVFWNMDGGVPASEWVREEVKGRKNVEAPILSSGLKVKQDGRGNVCDTYLGYFNNSGNNVYYNTQATSMFSTAFSGGNGLSVIPENFEKCCSLFAARKSIQKTWLNDKDEYSAPNENHPLWEEYKTDAVIYSLINTSSNQSSLRNITYQNKQWDIKNEWFFMDADTIKTLADEYEIDELYADVSKNGHETFVLKYIREHAFSKEAGDVLVKAKELVVKSMAYRKVMAEERPEYHLNCWDAGWYQVKKILNEYLKDDLKEFMKLYKVLEQKITRNTYGVGFLRK